jgi:hypothetical protein
MMRPFALEITAGDFALAASHRLTAISLVTGTLNSAAAFSIAAASSVDLDLAQPDGSAGDLVDVPDDRLRWFGLLRHVAVSAAKRPRRPASLILMRTISMVLRPETVTTSCCLVARPSWTSAAIMAHRIHGPGRAVPL